VGLKDISYDTIIVGGYLRGDPCRINENWAWLIIRICSTESNPFGKVNDSLCTYIHDRQREGM
jgi:hypothetical protein